MSQLSAEFEALLGNSIEIKKDAVKIIDSPKFRAKVHKLAEISALEKGPRQGYARYLINLAAQEMGIFPASINELYLGRGKGEVPCTFTVPALNLRVLGYHSAKAAFRAAISMDGAAMIFEIARSEIGYCDQRPSEYTASVLAAAIEEGYRGPVFLQGDHYQVNAKKYAADPNAEISALKSLMAESIAAGFYNIDVDASTLVEIDKKTTVEQQTVNVQLSAMFTAFIRANEPKGVTVSVGGEIGEIGGHNSNEEELQVYVDGVHAELKKLDPKAVGMSKISIQTGTSHGGIVLPDGSIAKVNVDFDCLKRLSRLSRNKYGMGGAVQHGASTLPEDAFGHFLENEAIEIHLATNFMNMFFDRIPSDLRDQMYAFLKEKNAADLKPGMTEEQFYYKTRKNAVGPYKPQSWGLPSENMNEIIFVWEEQFKKLFKLLGVAGTRSIVEKAVKPVYIKPVLKDYLGEAADLGDVKDLAD